MVQIATTKISSKGQIVIPSNMRDDLKEGDILLIIKGNDSLLLKKAGGLDKKFKDDLEFARRTEEAYKRHERGNFKSMPVEKFLAELERW